MKCLVLALAMLQWARYLDFVKDSEVHRPFSFAAGSIAKSGVRILRAIKRCLAESANLRSAAHIAVKLHHAAYVCRDLEQTRKFYEDILGWPMVAAWRECDKVFGEDELYYCMV
jgi:hypothetical protein